MRRCPLHDPVSTRWHRKRDPSQTRRVAAAARQAFKKT